MDTRMVLALIVGVALFLVGATNVVPVLEGTQPYFFFAAAFIIGLIAGGVKRGFLLGFFLSLAYGVVSFLIASALVTEILLAGIFSGVVGGILGAIGGSLTSLTRWIRKRRSRSISPRSDEAGKTENSIQS